LLTTFSITSTLQLQIGGATVNIQGAAKNDHRDTQGGKWLRQFEFIGVHSWFDFLRSIEVNGCQCSTTALGRPAGDPGIADGAGAALQLQPLPAVHRHLVEGWHGSKDSP
jgi:hypothetical protein